MREDIAVIFDFDGTLTAPGGIDFAAMRAAIGCPPDHTILEFIDQLDPDEQEAAHARVHALELSYAAVAQPNRYAEAVVCDLLDLGLPLAILTRNCRAAVDLAFANFASISATDFATIICRDSGLPPKPHPAAVLHIADTLGIAAAKLWMVGDYRFDLESGQAAGARTVYLRNGELPRWSADHIIANLSELAPLLRAHVA